jgi:hypothetical protein
VGLGDRPERLPAGRSIFRIIGSAPFVNQMDQELALIEAIVGRAPPFEFPRDEYGVPRRDY